MKRKAIIKYTKIARMAVSRMSVASSKVIEIHWA